MIIEHKTIVKVHMNGCEYDAPDSFETDLSPAAIHSAYVFCGNAGSENKVRAIKAMRTYFDIGLREAKAFVEDAIRDTE